MSSAIHSPCDILFEDRWLIVINKRPGLLSHPNPKGGEGEECAFLGSYDHDDQCYQSPAGKVYLIHRLDQDTSGVLLGAKDWRSAEACRLAFEEGRVKKLYAALTYGGGLKKEGEWLDHLSVKHHGRKVRTEVVRGARPNAQSRFRLISYAQTHRLTALEIELITGRTHQIRVQAAARHNPVAGDDIYGDFEANRRLRKDPGLKRLCLHALSLSLPHPSTGDRLTVTAPLPEEMAAFWPRP